MWQKLIDGLTLAYTNTLCAPDHLCVHPDYRAAFEQGLAASIPFPLVEQDSPVAFVTHPLKGKPMTICEVPWASPGVVVGVMGEGRVNLWDETRVCIIYLDAPQPLRLPLTWEFAAAA